jgi:hypothetical protein
MVMGNYLLWSVIYIYIYMEDFEEIALDGSNTNPLYLVNGSDTLMSLSSLDHMNQQD